MSDLASNTVAGLLQAIKADAGVRAVLGNPVRVSEDLPVQAAFPYLVLTSCSQKEGGAKGLSLLVLEVGFKVISRSKGGGEVRAILAALRAALHEGSPALTSGVVVSLREEAASCQWVQTRSQYEGLVRYIVKVSAS